MNNNMEITDNILPEDEEVIFSGLLNFNLERIEDKEPRDLGIYMRDDEHNIVGGLTGHTHGNWLHIKFLWVKEEWRGSGLGSKLLKEAEAEALRRECKYVFLDTFSFQAPEFYLKYGYHQAFILEEYPLTGKRYYFIKELINRI